MKKNLIYLTTVAFLFAFALNTAYAEEQNNDRSAAEADKEATQTTKRDLDTQSNNPPQSQFSSSSTEQMKKRQNEREMYDRSPDTRHRRSLIETNRFDRLFERREIGSRFFH